DAELLTLAQAGQLNNEATLKTQTRRMLKDPKVNGFALEFFGQWLNYRDFRQAEAVNRSVFPAFDDPLKQAMFEEPTRLVTHVLQNDLPITELLRSDATFVNKRLAQHYGLPFEGTADDWRLATGLHQQGRGGLLGMAVFLTKNSQPQRTSPVKRGFWVVHKLLGEHIPPPPPDVEALAPVDAPVLIPRFRPREPRGLNPEQQSRHGDPALAVWKYLCNRDLSLGDTVRRDCPAFDFGGLDMNVRDPLNRRGDAGVMLGNGTATMSLEEAGVARGWIRPPPPKGQSSLAGTTDQVNKPGGHELYEDLPQLEHPMEGAPDPN
ncbi:MAG: DUF1592 domain-containing protein, partial [Micropepsaceae bacterium]